MPEKNEEEGAMLQVEAWDTVEVELTSARMHSDPYLQVDVTAEFVGPNGQTIRRPAFWDGDTTWRVRFAPPAPGIWRYSTSEIAAIPGLHGITGTVDCGPYTGDNPVRRHGFLRVAANGRHLEHEDGAPFFWLADTHWRFAWERWDESNKPGWSSQFRDTVRLRVGQGFTVYQGNLLSWSPPDLWAQNDFSAVDPSYFREVIDPRMAFIADSGLVHALGLAWYHAADNDPAGLARFARYIVARYGAYPIVWTLGGEVAGYEPALRQQRLDAWRGVAHAIQEADDYRHPITAHLTNERPLPSYYQDEDWLSFTLNQLGHGDLDMTSRHWTEHLNAFPGRPLVEGESFYEGLKSVEQTGRRVVTDVMVRQVAYRAIQSGCCGYSYGAQGCWNGAWDADEARIAWGDLAWYDGVDLPGATQLGYLRKLYESVGWTQLRPAPERFEPSAGINETFYPPAVAAHEDGGTVLVYFGETYRFDEGTGRLCGMPRGACRIEWFDPRQGKTTVALEAAEPENGKIIVPTPPGDGDWVLIARE